MNSTETALVNVMEKIIDNQDILIKQNLFILEYLIGNEEKRQTLKDNLVKLFEESPCDE